MYRTFALWLFFGHVLTGCATQVATEVRSGRTALLGGKPDVALAHFHRGVEARPDFIADLPPLREGIWTYLGRAYYETGKLSEAREALAQALTRDESDFMARLYLGLTLLRAKSPPAKKDNSFALRDILYALRERVSPKRVATLVEERGTNFDLTAEAEKELRKAGADDELVAQIRISSKKRVKLEDSPAQQGLREADRALKEIQIWQEGIKLTEYGRFWDVRQGIRSQVAKSRSMFISRKVDRQELISGLEWIGKAIEEEVDLSRRDKLEYDKKLGSRRD